MGSGVSYLIKAFFSFSWTAMDQFMFSYQCQDSKVAEKGNPTMLQKERDQEEEAVMICFITRAKFIGAISHE